MNRFFEHDVVKTIRVVTEDDIIIPDGTIGTIVNVYASGYEVEFILFHKSEVVYCAEDSIIFHQPAVAYCAEDSIQEEQKIDGLSCAVKLMELNFSFLHKQLEMAQLLASYCKKDDKIKPFKKSIIDSFEETNTKIQNLVEYLKQI